MSSSNPPQYIPPLHLMEDSFISYDELIAWYYEFYAGIKDEPSTRTLAYEHLISNFNTLARKNGFTNSHAALEDCNGEDNGGRKLKTEISKLESGISVIKQECQPQIDTLESCENGHTNLQWSNNALKAKVELLESSISRIQLDYQKYVEVLKSKNLEARRKGQEQAETIERYKIKYERLCSSKKWLGAKVGVLTSKGRMLGLERRRLQLSNKKLEVKVGVLESKESEIIALQSLNKQLKQEMGEQGEALKNFNSRKRELRSEINRLSKELESLKPTVVRVEHQQENIPVQPRYETTPLLSKKRPREELGVLKPTAVARTFKVWDDSRVLKKNRIGG